MNLTFTQLNVCLTVLFISYTIVHVLNFHHIAKELRVNEQIRVPQVRLIDGENQVGIISTREAIDMARARDLDLIEVSPQADPPVCKILDFGKYKYHQQKVDHKQRVRSRSNEMKTIRLSPRIGPHDLETKVGQARKFLEKGARVKFDVIFKGRENAYIDIGKEKLKQIIEMLNDVSVIETDITKQDSTVSLTLKSPN